MSELLRPSRRSFLAQVVGGSFASGGAFGAVTGLAFAQGGPRRTCLTDGDPSDRAGYGTRTGLSDRDPFDRAGRGTFDGVTDRDPTDSANRGASLRCAAERVTSVTDSDAGANADPVGPGRGSAPAPRSARRGPTTQTMAREAPPPPPPPPAAARRTRSLSRTSSEVGFPDFPWPPPAPSSRRTLPRSQFVDARNRRPSLFDVGERLSAALQRASYSEYSFYGAPNGFVLVARLERFLDDGRTAPDTIRYLQPAEEPFSFVRYLTGLFIAPVGNYRQIAFVVTNHPFVASGKALSEEEAEQILRNGANALPAYFRSMRFSEDYSVTALVYEFQKRPREPALVRPARGRLGAQVHLLRSGIEPALESGR